MDDLLRLIAPERDSLLVLLTPDLLVPCPLLLLFSARLDTDLLMLLFRARLDTDLLRDWLCSGVFGVVVGGGFGVDVRQVVLALSLRFLLDC